MWEYIFAKESVFGRLGLERAAVCAARCTAGAFAWVPVHKKEST
jgi:hypothetical protein